MDKVELQVKLAEAAKKVNGLKVQIIAEEMVKRNMINDKSDLNKPSVGKRIKKVMKAGKEAIMYHNRYYWSTLLTFDTISKFKLDEADNIIIPEITYS